MATTGRRSPRKRQQRRAATSSAESERGERTAKPEPRTPKTPKTAKTPKRGHSGGRPSRQVVRQRRQVLALSVLTVLTVGYLLFFTSLLGVRSVEVVGARQVAAERVRELAAVPAEQPMLRVDTDAVAERVRALPAVATVEVSRSWPNTIEIMVTERTPVGFYDTGERLYLVDRGGVVYKQLPEPVEGLPRLELSKVGPADAATRAVASVLVGLPPQLREQVTIARADTPGSVELVLADGRVVRWGDAEQSERKAKVLAVLLTREGEVYDVSSPELPTVS